MSDEPSRDVPDPKPKTEKGIVVVESEMEGVYFVPALRCSDCEEMEVLAFAKDPGEVPVKQVRQFAIKNGPFTEEWEGVLYCMNCEQISKADFSGENVLEHTPEEWSEYLQERKRYGLDV